MRILIRPHSLLPREPAAPGPSPASFAFLLQGKEPGAAAREAVGRALDTYVRFEPHKDYSVYWQAAHGRVHIRWTEPDPGFRPETNSEKAPEKAPHYAEAFLKDLPRDEFTLISHLADGIERPYHPLRPAQDPDGRSLLEGKLAEFERYITDPDLRKRISEVAHQGHAAMLSELAMAIFRLDADYVPVSPGGISHSLSFWLDTPRQRGCAVTTSAAFHAKRITSEQIEPGLVLNLTRMTQISPPFGGEEAGSPFHAALPIHAQLVFRYEHPPGY